ncbi:MATE family efflux transporter [Turicibacter sanguinis]|nr:MATE family efflux transporter [Turicibacter sanguinis]MTN50336.1 MATE family efflux transporter [Turicibacter sanguinis]MTN53367.1 MATE family efflux transporter [Turicibacter sanguinis]MTN56618.1 MATE family efflux transporter [Turicibacter sanguinis]MTN59683.1 MATE family efflux transporter [Turicibacter sanguinis]
MNMDHILNANLFKVWSKFVMASVIGVVLNTIYTIIDGMFVGQGVGEIGLAAVNIVWPAITLIIGTGLMLGIGASSLIAISLGKKDIEEAEKYLGTTMVASIAIGALITIVGLLFRNPILRMLGADEMVMPYAQDYFSIFYCITIPYIFSTALNPIVRTDGNPKLAMMMVGIGAIANIILDYLLVIVFDFGIKGAAIATSASIVLSTLISLYYFLKGNSTIKIRKLYLKLDGKVLKEIVKIGFVSFMIQLSYGTIIFVQNNVMYAYGSNIDVAIYTVASYVNCFFVNVCTGISQGLQPLIGYHFGANKWTRMKQFLYLSIVISVVAGILVFIGIYSYGRELVSVFGISSENLEYGYQSILMYCLGSPIIGIIFTMSGYYQAIGKNIQANILSVSRGLIFQFILTLALPPLIGVSGVFLSLPIAEILTLMILVFMNGKRVMRLKFSY